MPMLSSSAEKLREQKSLNVCHKSKQESNKFRFKGYSFTLNINNLTNNFSFVKPADPLETLPPLVSLSSMRGGKRRSRGWVHSLQPVSRIASLELLSISITLAGLYKYTLDCVFCQVRISCHWHLNSGISTRPRQNGAHIHIFSLEYAPRCFTTLLTHPACEADHGTSGSAATHRAPDGCRSLQPREPGQQPSP